MALSESQINQLLALVAATEPDSLDCDGCSGQLAEFAELQLAAQELPEAMQALETHMRQCPCCRDEFQALLEGLRALDDA